MVFLIWKNVLNVCEMKFKNIIYEIRWKNSQPCMCTKCNHNIFQNKEYFIWECNVFQVLYSMWFACVMYIACMCYVDRECAKLGAVWGQQNMQSSMSCSKLQHCSLDFMFLILKWWGFAYIGWVIDIDIRTNMLALQANP